MLNLNVDDIAISRPDPRGLQTSCLLVDDENLILRGSAVDADAAEPVHDAG